MTDYPHEWHELWGGQDDGGWRGWLMELGIAKKAAGKLVGRVLKLCKGDCYQASWTFRRVRDSGRNGRVTAKNVAAFLMQDINGGERRR